MSGSFPAIVARMVVPMMVHAVTGAPPPGESEQERNQQHRKDRKKEMMRVRIKCVGRVGPAGVEIMRPEEPGDRGDDEREQGYSRQQVKNMMAAPMTAHFAPLIVVLGRGRIVWLIDGKLFADADAEFGHGWVLRLNSGPISS